MNAIIPEKEKLYVVVWDKDSCDWKEFKPTHESYGLGSVIKFKWSDGKIYHKIKKKKCYDLSSFLDFVEFVEWEDTTSDEVEVIIAQDISRKMQNETDMVQAAPTSPRNRF